MLGERPEWQQEARAEGGQTGVPRGACHKGIKRICRKKYEKKKISGKVACISLVKLGYAALLVGPAGMPTCLLAGCGAICVQFCSSCFPYFPLPSLGHKFCAFLLPGLALNCAFPPTLIPRLLFPSRRGELLLSAPKKCSVRTRPITSLS